jgi:arginase family enzyme
MLLLIRQRYPRVANIVGFFTGVITLAIGIACGAGATVLVLGGGSSVALGVVRYLGQRHPRLAAGGGTPTAR